MWYSVRRVAAERFLDEEVALEVARESRFTSMIGGELHTNSWMLDAFVTEVKLAQGERTAIIRESLIARRMKRFASAV